MWKKSDLFVPAVMLGLEETLRLAAERELNVEFQGMYAPERLSGYAYSENIGIARAAFSGFRGRVMVHAPFYDVNPVSRDAEIREISRRRCGQAFEIAAAVRAEGIVFHSMYAACSRDPDYAARWLDASASYWKGVDSGLGAERTRICFENIFDPDFTMIARLLDAIGSPRFSACLDTGHARLFFRDRDSAVRAAFARIGHLHLHDNDGAWDLHEAPGPGSAGLAGLMSELAGREPPPSVTLEIHSAQGVAAGIGWLESWGLLGSDLS